MTPHDVVLRGLGGGAPLLIERTDQKWMDATLAQISVPDPLTPMQDYLPDTDPDASALKLFQPVHRSHALVMCEALCEVFGEPPLDPASIDSRGFVVRRVAKANPNKHGSNDGQPSRIRVLEAWVESQGQLRGWLTLDPNDADLDPDPARRPQPFHAGQPEMKKLLAALQPAAPPLVERTQPLYTASPAVSLASGRTILYGVVPVTSSETSEASPQLSAVADDDATEQLVQRVLPAYFQSNDGLVLGSSIGGQTFAASDAKQNSDTAFQQYVQYLSTLQVQLDYLGTSSESASLRSATDQLLIYYTTDPNEQGTALTQHLTDGINILVLGGDGTVTLPVSYGAVSSTLAQTLHDAVEQALSARSRAVLPAEGRFEDEKALYQVRAFIRVKRDDGCPPEIVWSDPSPDFMIAPWYESGKLPPSVVTLPPLTNIKKFKPNVAFKVPGSLFNFLNNNKAKDLINGQGSAGGDDGIDWICGFNIPIITICAFIILYLFLTLLDFVFWWLAFIKICIPIPRKL